MNKELPEGPVPGWGMLERAVEAVVGDAVLTGFEHLPDDELVRRLALMRRRAERNPDFPPLNPDCPPPTRSTMPSPASMSDDELLNAIRAYRIRAHQPPVGLSPLDVERQARPLTSLSDDELLNEIRALDDSHPPRSRTP